MQITITLLTKSHEQHSCKRKVRYGHEETAIRATRRMSEKHGKKYEAYECLYCEEWHIGASMEDS